MRRYHVQLTDGTETDITAASCAVPAGVLVFTDGAGAIVEAFGPGTWAHVETEARDDK